MSLCQVADQILPQRRKAVATVPDTIVVSVPLPATGGLVTVDVLLSHGQTYVRDIQNFLVPRVIAHSGYRWRNAANRNEMMQSSEPLPSIKEVYMSTGMLLQHGQRT